MKFYLNLLLSLLLLFSCNSENEVSLEQFYFTDERLSGLLSNQDFLSQLTNPCKVVRVVDGDTIDVDCPTWPEIQSVRYLDIDTPEVRKKVSNRWVDDFECFGKESSEINKNLVSGKTVYLIEGLVNKDKYGRRLAYVFVDNGQDKKLHLNLYLVATGTAKSWKYNDVINFRSGIHYENILGMEQIAQKYEMGLWGECY